MLAPLAGGFWKGVSHMHHDPIIRQLHACVVSHVPCALEGIPGGGKTARVTAYAALRGLPVERFLLSRCEPIDLRPRIYHDGHVLVRRAPEIDRLEASPVGGILFLDELNRSSREVEGAALDLIDSPPEGVSVVAACNPPSRGQSARSLESAAANRFCHLSVPSDAQAYAQALLSGWGSPDGAAALTLPDDDSIAIETQTARALGSGFLRHRGTDALHKEPTTPIEAGRAWPSPRSWEAALRLYATSRALGYAADDTIALVGGCVGAGLAVEFLAYAADSEVDPEVLLASPGAWIPPQNRVDKTIGALSMVLAAVTRDLTDPRWRAAWKLADRCVVADQADAALFLVEALTHLAPRGRDLTAAHTLMPIRIAKLYNRSRKP